MELILIRHGESYGNIKHVVYGHVDYPMTEKGLRQVPFIIQALQRYPVTAVYSSPLKRALAVGEAIGENRNLKVNQDDRLKEIGFGVYEDRPKEEIISEIGEEAYYQLIGFFDHMEIPDGEDQDVFLKRVQHFTDELLAKEDGVYVITAHFGVIKAILNYLMGFTKKQLRQFAIKPGALVKLSIKSDRVRMDELIQTYSEA